MKNRVTQWTINGEKQNWNVNEGCSRMSKIGQEEEEQSVAHRPPKYPLTLATMLSTVPLELMLRTLIIYLYLYSVNW